METIDNALGRFKKQHSQSQSAEASAWPGRDDEAYRLKLLGELMGAKSPAAQADPELTLEVALADTADIPCFWLNRACLDIRRNDENPFFPPAATIRKTAARMFRAEKERATGLVEYSPTRGRLPLRVSFEIEKMAQGPEVAGLLAHSERKLLR